MKIAHFIRVGRLLLGTLTLCLSAGAMAYPFSQEDIKQLLVEEAIYQGVSPSLVLAIAKVESDFNPSALSHAGAKGVMQIMPATAKNVFQVAEHELFNANVNIRIGVAFIKQLLEQYDGRVDIALSHYNGGSRVNRPNGKLRVIPATSTYVNKVKMYARRFENPSYDHRTGLAGLEIPAHQQNNERIALTYAQQMAFDEFDYPDGAEQNTLFDAQKKAPHLRKEGRQLVSKKNGPNPRINHLQDLREHNLTRLLPAKNTSAESNNSISSSQSPVAEGETKFTKLPFIRGPKKSPIERTLAKTVLQPSTSLASTLSPSSTAQSRISDFPLAIEAAFEPVSFEHKGNKQQQVASWEAIFD